MPPGRRFTLLVVLLSTAGCYGGAVESQRRVSPLVYGADNRQPLYEVPAGDALGTIGQKSLLALGRESEIQSTEPGPGGEARVRVTSPSARERLALCPNERFGTQAAFALCSAFPVAAHLALTAGHCLDLLPEQDLVVLSGFYETAPDVIAPIAATQVHAIEQVVARDPSSDVALLRLSGEALRPLSLAPSLPLFGDALWSLNHGMGVPAQLVAGGQAFSVGEHSCLSDLDTFGGASGAPVFDKTFSVVGLLTSGLADYDPTEAGCWTTRHETAGSLGAGELVEHARSALDNLCELRFVPEVCDQATRSAPGCSVTPRAHAGGSPAWFVLLAFAFLAGWLRASPKPSRRARAR
jgi:hypothetical protein